VYRTTPGANLGFQWSITGNGSIIGSTTADSVEVTAGSAGSFKLTLVVSQTNCAQCTTTCDKTVTVNPVPTCSIEGPKVCESSTNNLYVGTSTLAGSSFQWSITGNGSIAGSATNDSVYVNAG